LAKRGEISNDISLRNQREDRGNGVRRLSALGRVRERYSDFGSEGGSSRKRNTCWGLGLKRNMGFRGSGRTLVRREGGVESVRGEKRVGCARGLAVRGAT